MKEVYRYKSFVKLTLVKLDFSHLVYKACRVGGGGEKTNSEKVKHNIRGYRSRNQNEKRHIHRLEVLGK